VHIVTAVGPFSTDGIEVSREMARVRDFQATAEATLKAVGLVTASTVHAASPIDLLVDQAQKWGADCIFVGAWGYGSFGFRIFGSVPAALPARAACSVEVVRDTTATAEIAS
jgi:nucleotide-binding universal stress UspA family protein